MRASKF